jgi:DNA mismatch endonuclease (patch repair protein)
MLSNRRKDTRPELLIRSRLHQAGLRFRIDYPLSLPIGRPIRIDVAFPRLKVAIFIDGCFWHCCPEHGSQPRTNAQYWQPKLERNVLRAAQVNSGLSELGWLVIRAWEHEEPMAVAARIRLTINERRADLVNARRIEGRAE